MTTWRCSPCTATSPVRALFFCRRRRPPPRLLTAAHPPAPPRAGVTHSTCLTRACPTAVFALHLLQTTNLSLKKSLDLP